MDKLSDDDDNDDCRRRSSRTVRTSEKANERAKALETIRLLKSTGQKHRLQIDEVCKPIYDEVDEKEYEKIVRQRREDNFVVDDGGGEYVDDGGDLFDDEDDGAPSKKSRMKSDTNESSMNKPKKGTITASFFTTSRKPIDEKNVTTAGDDVLESMLQAIVPNRSSSKRQASVELVPRPLKAVRRIVKTRLSSTHDDQPMMHDPLYPRLVPDVEPIVDCDVQDIKPVVDSHLSKEFAPIEDNNYMLEECASIEDNNNTIDEQTTVVDDASLLVSTNDGGESVLRMYMLDAYEDPIKHPGIVYLFGRVPNNRNKHQTFSCCVIVKNIERIVYFLKRDTRYKNGKNTDEPIAFDDVRQELFEYFRKHLKTSEFRCRETVKKFAFGNSHLNNATEATVVEVRYSGKSLQLSPDMSGETFSCVFNASATSLETLILERELRGPGWIDITNPAGHYPPIGYCRHEFIVENMNTISRSKLADAPPPPLILLALNCVTVSNEQKQQEIVIISGLIHYRYSIDMLNNVDQKKLKQFCIVAKSSRGTMPFDIRDQLQRGRYQQSVDIVANERALINLFLVKLQNIDPDIILGHDMSAQLELLIQKIGQLKIAHWSRTSRLRRTINAPKSIHYKSALWEVTAGRLLIDSRTSAMELMDKARSYDLGALSMQLIGEQRELLLASDIPDMFSNSKTLIQLILSSWKDTWLSLRIVAELNAIQLFVQITQIVGGILSRTLMGGRAERNEYLLLHAFHREGYICPDRLVKKRSDAPDENAGGERKKAQYAGGLVLEPKKGFYDSYILLLDFNSLYPTIIQEFNICFTTVARTNKSNESFGDIPNVPDADLPEGILPKEIRVLVDRRREVKKLMNDPHLPDWKRKQYEIRQKGLKLTANSLYGCLGFANARFYAKPLAALITAKGREILLHTKDLVEKQGLSVIYGDTDSIMIDTNLRDIDEVKQLGIKIKKLVNKCHRLLELDIDGIFKMLLLLKKKKYSGLSVDLNNVSIVHRQDKGLDTMRRDWSQLAKDAGNNVLDIIFSGKSRDDLIEDIHESLRSLKQMIDNGQIGIEKYLISNQLTKNPSEYADTKMLPQAAAVAQRLNATGNFHFHQGDTVFYLICEDGTNNSHTQRAYHEAELKMNDQLRIDYRYYLTHQIYPVVLRLVEPFAETDASRIAECLGLDPTTYRRPIDENSENAHIKVNLHELFCYMIRS